MPFHGAPELIAQALDKLVDNARSFAPDDGWIEIALDAIDGGAEIRVANSGPPLPATMQERLFDSLVSVREAGARAGGETPHLGLGLYVVRLVAELHRGSRRRTISPTARGVEFGCGCPACRGVDCPRDLRCVIVLRLRSPHCSAARRSRVPSST